MPGMDPSELVAAERARTLAQIADLTSAFDDVVESAELAVNDDEHDPDGSTVAFERAQVAALLRDARARLGELDRAVERLADGTYGRCATCGEPIGDERLAARPTTDACIVCAAAPRRLG
jgi:RNA polymerase-binding transcription factor DksA